MKKYKIIFAIITLGLSFYFALAITKKVFAKKEIAANKIENLQENSFQDGDIFFQTSQSEQCEAVRIATNSKFSHCGMLLVIDGQKMIFEAVQPVKLTPIQDWITHGKDNKYVVSRLKNAKTVLTFFNRDTTYLLSFPCVIQSWTGVNFTGCTASKIIFWPSITNKIPQCENLELVAIRTASHCSDCEV